MYLKNVYYKTQFTRNKVDSLDDGQGNPPEKNTPSFPPGLEQLNNRVGHLQKLWLGWFTSPGPAGDYNSKNFFSLLNYAKDW